jgi:hypothetical protein
MTDRIRIVKHEVVPGCGSFEVRFPDDRPAGLSIGTTYRHAGSGDFRSRNRFGRGEGGTKSRTETR